MIIDQTLSSGLCSTQSTAVVSYGIRLLHMVGVTNFRDGGGVGSGLQSFFENCRDNFGPCWESVTYLKVK